MHQSCVHFHQTLFPQVLNPVYVQVSFFITALPAGTTEEAIRAQLPEAQRTGIKSIVLVSTSSSAFVNFSNRQAAEAAALIWGAQDAQLSFGDSEKKARVQWGRSKKAKPAPTPIASGSGSALVV